MSTHLQLYSTQAEGGLLSLEFIQTLVDGRADGLKLEAKDFGLGERVNLANHLAESFGMLGQLWQLTQRGTPKEQHLNRQHFVNILLERLGYHDSPAFEGLDDESMISSGHKLYGIDEVAIWRLNTPKEVKRPLDEGKPYGLTSSPHALMQRLLNHRDDHLWAIVCDGRKLRLMRDHYRLARQAYLEWDLDLIFEQLHTQDFKALFVLAHAKTLCKPTDQDSARIEDWMRRSEQSGVRALETLEASVRGAIEALGAGLVRHTKNGALREALSKGQLSTQTLYHGVLRYIYRLIFLLVAESRGVLHPIDCDERAKMLYLAEYGLLPLRERAKVFRGTAHADIWERVKLVFAALDQGQPALALPALGSSLWHPEFIDPRIAQALIGNDATLAALRALCFTQTPDGTLHLVNWRAIGAEELGSVYESLLSSQPYLNTSERVFELREIDGSERKTSGSYYTPTSLVELLLKSALEPVIERALGSAKDAEGKQAALLALNICDPSCGSGHFLVAAAHRVALALAKVSTGEQDPPPSAYRHALRQVIANCIYGVDLNPMAVELCKVSLWMESMEPGKPLAFLDAHIQHGNSLVGATPSLLKEPIPADAFKELEGDDKKIGQRLRARHKKEIKQDPSVHAPKKGKKKDEPLPLELYTQELQHNPYARAILEAARSHLQGAQAALARLADDTRQAIGEVEQSWKAYITGDTYKTSKHIADTWCAAFVWPMCSPDDEESAPTHANWRALLDPRYTPPQGSSLAETLRKLRCRVERLASQLNFFHWHLAFPAVFGLPTLDTQSGWEGGFDVILGNPPWEHVELKEKEFFASLRPEIAEAPGDTRKQLIAALEVGCEADREVFTLYQNAKRAIDAERFLLRASELYPLCGRGRVNTYAVFSELILHITGPQGRAGFIVPSGIAMDDTTKLYFQQITDQRALAAFYDFENKGLFNKVDSRFKFALVTLCAPGTGPEESEMAFFLHDPAELEAEDAADRIIHLSADDIARINPNTFTCPIFRSRRDADITRDIYRRVPVLIREATEGKEEQNPWDVQFRQGLFNMTSDSNLFRTYEQLDADGWELRGNRFVRDEEVMLPLYEAKMIHHYTHRWASYEGVVGSSDDDEKLQTHDFSIDELNDPSVSPRPRYWVASTDVTDRLKDKWDRQWLMGWRDICRSTDERTVIASTLSKSGTGDTLLLAFPSQEPKQMLPAIWSSYALDYCARQKVGGTHLKYHVFKQLPVLTPETFNEAAAWTEGKKLTDWITPRVVELTYTAWDMEPFARDCGDVGAPFVWDEARRFELRAELDAAMFHLYGINREDVEYIMGTFPIVERRDRARSVTDEEPEGRYLTRDAILAVYDRMASGESVPYVEGARHPDR